jgi:NTP pyrophosphatase (non-canonical NTP hydrolase)
MAKKEPEGFATDAQKEKAQEVAEQMQKAREERAEQITVDLDKYSKFVQVMTSAPSKKFDSYVERINELNEAGCDVSRLNTAAIGIVAEAGEFAEIVKKILFQGKEYNQDNIDHMIIELGDILWYISQAATALGVRLDDILLGNTMKLLKRYPDGEFDVLKSEYSAPNDL